MATRVRVGKDYCALVTEPIDLGFLAEKVRTDGSGAVVLFTGVVRDHHLGKRVERLEYEAYVPMVEQEMRRIAAELHSRWDLEAVAIVHRTGPLEIGETSVAVAVASAHRREALEACSQAIDRIKQTLPIWKKEFGEEGAGWVLGDDSPSASLAPILPRRNRSSRRPAGG